MELQREQRKRTRNCCDACALTMKRGSPIWEFHRGRLRGHCSSRACKRPSYNLDPVKLPGINMYYKLHHLSGSYEITRESTHHQQHQLPIDWYGREMDWYGQGWRHSLTSYLHVLINRGVNCPSPFPLFKSQWTAKAPLPLLCIQPHVWRQVHSSGHPDNSSWAMQPRYQISVYIL